MTTAAAVGARRIDVGKLLPQLIAPVVALVIAAAISSIALLISDKDPLAAFQHMYEFGTQPDQMVEILNKASELYIAAVAVAIGFKMGLFNIGVEGQSKVGAFFAGALASASFMDWMPGGLRIVLIVVVAMLVGAAWASIAALLKTQRGVSEVISTLMLNAIGGLVVTWLLNDHWGVTEPGAQIKTTGILPESSWMPGLPIISGTDQKVLGFFAIAVFLGAAYWFVINRTRFGFDLRATGYNPFAAVASGVNAKRMVITAMLISGAVAGLVNLPRMLGESHTYTEGFGGIGFTGIAVALLGRNHPIGMALGAILWGFLASSQIILDLDGIPKEIILIMQGVTVLSVVIAYELAARIGRRAQQRRVGVATAAPAPVPAVVEESK
ncbi:ABC transporter permease [Dactylosporangium aurantiacum]|uniref:ABC transporter permease n=1 Tax=Dactylosporangium aurantiacum TaxID=35754 RepID=A0A9Q9MDV3_9ACTN|nr:ABC transporter permease [Dactylosporangium aurantiacum]MDG6109388.1 ABC transporter permease [Dactylosporangium aurantiacum]UWZ55478.1 ABC transporter permease [Dactylosporangium aurantiacum]